MPANNLLSQHSCSNHLDETLKQKEFNSDASIAITEVIDEELEEFKLTNSLTSWQMRITIKNTALTSDRYGLSDRATAAIASSVLQDFCIVTNYDPSLVVDKNKIRRAKGTNRSQLQMQSKEKFNSLQGLYFDGRKDKTLGVEKIKSKRFRRSIKEKHNSILQEPVSVYVCHVSPTSESAENIASSIISYLNEAVFSFYELDVIGCNGTVTNTGSKFSVIVTIEKYVNRPLQWGICLLHINELPFRHLFQTLDGETTGPKSFSGPIGAQLNKCEKLPVVKFVSVHCEIPEIDRKILSKDQQFFLDISSAIKSGSCSEDLFVREPGAISHQDG
ncbi:uncharacterized protein LOC136072702 [Hydra vulgaris]|uniref:uncharacterized protein LOC136072702 n=1 Tax=Hydra vulgaris TaxID=6087 RepID=UPI0032E9BF22